MILTKFNSGEIMKIRQIILIGILVLFSLPIFAQETEPEKPNKTPFLGFKDNRDVYFQLLIGTGYSFYKMKGEEELITFLNNDGYNINDMSGQIHFSLGLGVLIKQPEIRLLFDYRNDGYSSESPVYITFHFGSENKSFKLEHDIRTVSIGAEKLLFLDEEKKGFVGLGASYLWINDDRNETLEYQLGSLTKNSKNTLGLTAKAWQIQASFGSLMSAKIFAEGRIGYQFQQSFKIESENKKPGRSAEGYEPNFNTFTFKFMFGVLL